MAFPFPKIDFRRLLTGVSGVVIFLLGLAFVLGWLSLKRAQEIISDDFQQQQLILARTTARQIEEGLAFLRREMKILAYSPAIQYLESVAWANRMKISFDALSQMGVTAIERIDFEDSRVDKLYILDKKGPRVLHEDYSALPLVKWAQDPGNKGIIYQGPVEVKQQNSGKAPFMTMATPVYLESVDESHPKPPGGVDGVILFQLDLSAFVGRYCADIRSGRSGYCWVLNKDGVFLYHPEREFIGEDAFTARGKRNPVIRFDQINEIQKTKMLTGEEGTSQYISGWHRGVIGQMEKFLAYSYARIDPECFGEKTGLAGPQASKSPTCEWIWPIAVVAPIDEVKGTVHSLYFRQFLLQGVLIFALVLAGAAIIYYELRWSVELQREVDRTTTDLRRSREQYKSVVENARDFIFLLDHTGTFISVNTAAARAFHRPAKGFTGKKLTDLMTQEDAQAMLEQVRDVLDSGRVSEVRTAVRIHERIYWLSTHFVPIMGEDDRTAERVLVMARDITDHKHMEDQMAQTEKLASLGTLAAGVAHEINNPLGIMLGFTEILLDKAVPDSKEHQLLKTIEKQGLNAKRIVENLMTFARQPAKKEDFTDLNATIDNVLELVKNSLLTKKVDLEVRLSKQLPRVRGDAGELQQVFLNLINNAMAAMSGGGRLMVITKTNPYTHLVEAIFADTGTGIPKEVADRIFDPFFTTKKVGEGTGLGLSVSYAIVTKYGGNIRFETRAVSDAGGPSGTTFFVALQPEIVAAPAADLTPRAAN